MVQDFPESYFRTDFNYFPKDFTLKCANVQSNTSKAIDYKFTFEKVILLVVVK